MCYATVSINVDETEYGKIYLLITSFEKSIFYYVGLLDFYMRQTKENDTQFVIWVNSSS